MPLTDYGQKPGVRAEITRFLQQAVSRPMTELSFELIELACPVASNRTTKQTSSDNFSPFELPQPMNVSRDVTSLGATQVHIRHFRMGIEQKRY